MGSRPLFRALAVAIVLIFGAAAILLSAFLAGRSQNKMRERALRQIGVALRLYANENKIGMYPPKSADPAAFSPDMTFLEGYFADSAEGRNLIDYLTGRGPERLCYLGHLIGDEDMALRLLDEYEKGDPDEVRNKDFKVDRDARFTDAYRLREGIERFRIWDVMNPAVSVDTKADIPILWEIPAGSGPQQALVLYLDGHTEWRPYPGEFPMSKRFIERVRRITGLAGPTSPPVATVPAIETAVDRALEVASRWAMPLEHWRVVQRDTTPTVAVRDRRGYRIVFATTSTRVSGDSSFSDIDRSNLPGIASQKLVEVPPGLLRISRPEHSLRERFELVLFPVAPDAANPMDVRAADIPWTIAVDTGWNPVQANMGTGHGYHWFGNLSFFHQQLLRTKLDLKGGDSPFELYMIPFRQRPRTAADCLILRQMAGRTDQEKLAELEKQCAKPVSVAAYFDAFEAKRFLERKPVPIEVLGARSALISCATRCVTGFDYRWFPSGVILAEAQDVLLHAPDLEAVTAAAVDLVFREGKSRDAHSLQGASWDVLKQLPRDPAVALLNHLAANLQNPAEANQAAAIGNAL